MSAPRQRPWRRLRSTPSIAGYTAVEVLLALTVLLISSAGVMSMQKASIQGNMDARNLDVANSIARTWLDRLTTDADAWNSGTGMTQTLWLGADLGKGFVTPSVEPATLSAWSPAFDILGRDLLTTADPTAAFCTHIKIDAMAIGPTGTPTLLRATVLVFWRKNLAGAAGAPSTPFCPGPNDVAAQEAATPGVYHMLFASEAIRSST